MKTKTFILALLACLAVGPVDRLCAAQKAAPKAAPVTVTNATAAAVAAGNVDTYKPVPMDKFSFHIVEDPAKGTDELLSVSALGELRFPIGRGASEIITVNVRGKTMAEVKKELKAQLDADYYQDATIFLRLQDQVLKPGKIYITGAIKQNLPLNPGETLTVYTALLQVGSNDFANLKEVKLWRLNPVTQKEEPQIVNVNSMLKGGSREKDIVLQDGDRIEVPEKGILF